MADVAYKSFEYLLLNKGIVARYAIDRLPDYSYLNQNACLSRQENAISSTYGTQMITTNGTNNVPPGGPVVNLFRLKGLNGLTARYAQAGNQLVRRQADTQGAYTVIGSMSETFATAGVYRPDLNSNPYIFFALGAGFGIGGMLKDNGLFSNPQNWGISPPYVPPTIAIGDPARTIIDSFESSTAGYTAVNLSGFTTGVRINTTIAAAISSVGVQAVTPASMVNIVPGCLVVINQGLGDAETVMVMSISLTTFTANFTQTHAINSTVKSQYFTGNVGSNTTATLTKTGAFNLGVLGGGASSSAQDLINLFLLISDPSQIQEIKLMFDVGDGSFTQSYYYKSIMPAQEQAAVSGTETGSQATNDLTFSRGAGAVDIRTKGATIDAVTGQPIVPQDLLPHDYQRLRQVRPRPILTGHQNWSQILTYLGDFTPVGQAGTIGFTWANVNAWRIQVQTINGGSATMGFDDLYLLGGSGPDSFGGTAYDYRYTYYNQNTGAESNPSVPMVISSFLTPQRQSMTIKWSASPDTQVTHVRIYRRGGTLTTGWFKLGVDVAIGTTSFSDHYADSEIVGNKILELDNDPPLTTALPVPANFTTGAVINNTTSPQTIQINANPAGILTVGSQVTVDSGANQETVYLQAVQTSPFFAIVAVFQQAHSSAIPVTGTTLPTTGVPLCAFEFDRAWFAGDQNNPHYLYYSKQFRPESCPPQNFIEVGTPDDPIMGIVGTKGALYVATLTRWWIIQVFPGAIPVPYPTACRHGLVSYGAWCLGESSEIWYESHDGIRVFTGGADQFVSDPVDWIFTNNTTGPIVPMDNTKRQSGGVNTGNILAFYNREVYLSYTGVDGNRHRVIYHTFYKRWRNDDVAANAMLLERDTNTLVFGDAVTGNILQDQANDFYDGGFVGGVRQKNPIPINLQTLYIDQGSPEKQKVYNSLLVDCDTAGQNLTLTLTFDNGTQNPLVVSTTLNSNGRSKVPLNINAGQGQTAYNVSMQITGSVTKAITFWQINIQGVLKSINRRSFDTYFLKFGTDQLKLLKQSYWEYEAPDPAGVTISAYMDGRSTAEFTFALPQTTTRTAIRLRHPALKFKLLRVVGTSPSAFIIYEESNFDVKPVGGPFGYGKQKLEII